VERNEIQILTIFVTLFMLLKLWSIHAERIVVLVPYLYSCVCCLGIVGLACMQKGPIGPCSACVIYYTEGPYILVNLIEMHKRPMLCGLPLELEAHIH
jgi:hypothetical protein